MCAVQVSCPARCPDIDHRHDAADHGGELGQAGGIQLLGRQRLVGGAEGDRLGLDLGDTAARTDRLIVQAGAGLALIDRRPLGIDRERKACARAGDFGAKAAVAAIARPATAPTSTLRFIFISSPFGSGGAPRFAFSSRTAGARPGCSGRWLIDWPRGALVHLTKLSWICSLTLRFMYQLVPMSKIVSTAAQDARQARRVVGGAGCRCQFRSASL